MQIDCELFRGRGFETADFLELRIKDRDFKRAGAVIRCQILFDFAMTLARTPFQAAAQPSAVPSSMTIAKNLEKPDR